MGLSQAPEGVWSRSTACLGRGAALLLMSLSASWNSACALSTQSKQRGASKHAGTLCSDIAIQVAVKQLGNHIRPGLREWAEKVTEVPALAVSYNSTALLHQTTARILTPPATFICTTPGPSFDHGTARKLTRCCSTCILHCSCKRSHRAIPSLTGGYNRLEQQARAPSSAGLPAKWMAGSDGAICSACSTGQATSPAPTSNPARRCWSSCKCAHRPLVCLP